MQQFSSLCFVILLAVTSVVSTPFAFTQRYILSSILLFYWILTASSRKCGTVVTENVRQAEVEFQRTKALTQTLATGKEAKSFNINVGAFMQPVVNDEPLTEYITH
jgi:hypothetical protein